MRRRANLLFVSLLIVTDLLMVSLAFYAAYWLRQMIAVPPPVNIGPFADYAGMMLIHVVTVPTLYFFSRLYDVKRSMPRLDEIYRIFAATSIGTIVTIALTTFLFKNSALEMDFPRAMVLYSWFITVVLVSFSRSALVLLRNWLRRRGMWTDRLLIVGTGDVGRMILQKVRQMPRLGYRVVGFIDGNCPAGQDIMGVPVLGGIDDLPDVIREHEIQEVIIGRPELPNQELLAIVARCERGQVGIKIFPDLFQIIATEMSIGDLGGLPLLNVRDVALRGWKLTLKRGASSKRLMRFMAPETEAPEASLTWPVTVESGRSWTTGSLVSRASKAKTAPRLESACSARPMTTPSEAICSMWRGACPALSAACQPNWGGWRSDTTQRGSGFRA